MDISMIPDTVLAATNPVHWGGFKWYGNFTTIDLIAATTNAFNGAMLVREPSHYRKYSIVGILLFAILGGIGGGVTRDVLVSDVPAALQNPAYLTLCILAGIAGYLIAFDREERFRHGTFQILTAFSLPWYAIVGAQKGVDVGLPVWGCLMLAVVGPTAGRWFIDVCSGVTPKHFVQSEWWTTIAFLTGLVWILTYSFVTSNTWVCAGVAFLVGFTVRLLAITRKWEEPLPKHMVVDVPGDDELRLPRL
ncbi:MAG: TRIC cation channel family protein [Thermomicrobiales bacterium]